MSKNEINVFIEEMEEIGDVWAREDVERVYGNSSLKEALNTRRSELNQFFNVVGMAINS